MKAKYKLNKIIDGNIKKIKKEIGDISYKPEWVRDLTWTYKNYE